ncbi:MAG: YdeI/OmpD-associated family protein [Luteimonas sp.]
MTRVAPPDGLPVLAFVDATAWEAWLVAHADGKGLWLKIAKQGGTAASVTYAQALDVALCHGWIDGQKRGCDDAWFLQRFTPRRPRSLWSARNVAHVSRLQAAGRIREAGQREIDAARADGRWDAAYAGASTMTPPPELIAALAATPGARAAFDGLDRTHRYAVCFRVATLKTAAGRERRAQALAALLAGGGRLHG